MAVAESRQSPPAVLRQELADARQRGLEFDMAWEVAVVRALAGTRRGEDLDTWIGAFIWAWPFFRCAYVGEAFDRCSRSFDP